MIIELSMVERLGTIRYKIPKATPKLKREPELPFIRTRLLAARNQLTIADIHGDFETETHFGSCWFGPHGKASLGSNFKFGELAAIRLYDCSMRLTFLAALHPFMKQAS